ncbi:MAG TPA: hypothetical protein VMM79_18325 [Longimicrobiales bacterium]|nr:hypothetical protein [Longimicrobiales bacterium]
MLVAACGSGSQYSTSGGLVGVGLVLVSPVFFGSGTSAPANLEVVVENRAAQPLVVRSVRAQSSGMVQWGIYPVQRTFNETINPGEAKSFPLFATAVARYARMTPNEPLNVRAVVEFETAGKRYQELYHGQAHEP